MVLQKTEKRNIYDRDLTHDLSKAIRDIDISFETNYISLEKELDTLSTRLTELQYVEPYLLNIKIDNSFEAIAAQAEQVQIVKRLKDDVKAIYREKTGREIEWDHPEAEEIEEDIEETEQEVEEEVIPELEDVEETVRQEEEERLEEERRQQEEERRRTEEARARERERQERRRREEEELERRFEETTRIRTQEPEGAEGVLTDSTELSTDVANILEGDPLSVRTDRGWYVTVEIGGETVRLSAPTGRRTTEATYTGTLSDGTPVAVTGTQTSSTGGMTFTPESITVGRDVTGTTNADGSTTVVEYGANGRTTTTYGDDGSITQTNENGNVVTTRSSTGTGNTTTTIENLATGEETVRTSYTDPTRPQDGEIRTREESYDPSTGKTTVSEKTKDPSTGQTTTKTTETQGGKTTETTETTNADGTVHKVTTVEDITSAEHFTYTFDRNSDGSTTEVYVDEDTGNRVERTKNPDGTWTEKTTIDGHTTVKTGSDDTSGGDSGDESSDD